VGYEGVEGMDHYFAVAGGAVRFGVEGATANANADPPFGFAQGRLFGDDNQKGNSTAKQGKLQKQGQL
jgi:hypothetical protein